jgi:hypothetical protein
LTKHEDNKKERVLHARISDTLDQELKARSTELGVSVSNLVRNVLLNSFGLVNSVVKDGVTVARTARGETVTSTPTPGDPAVIGWQTMILNRNALCATCNAILARGTEAAVAVVSRRAQYLEPRLTLCSKCLKEIGNEDANDRNT